MNIFSVLSTGKSNLREPSMSAMLAYLLNPNQDHGLSAKVINSFLQLANKDGIYDTFISNTNLKFEIDLEVAYTYQKKRKDIDIQIKILDKSNHERHRIIIENKIKSSSANPDQLNSYYQAILGDKDNDDAFELEENDLSVIFLTPKLQNEALEYEFNNLQAHNKVWLYWNDEKSDAPTIVGLIQDILRLEQSAEISPINGYMRHTLKAFTYYIIKTIDINNGKNRVGEDIGEVKSKEEISIKNETYILVLRDSTQIQLFNCDGDKIIARPLLKEFLQEHGIPERYPNTNTRIMGKQIFDYLNSKYS